MASFNSILTEVAAWVSGSPAFTVVAGVSWIIPALQSVHILAVAVVMGSAAMVDLRVLGVVERHRPVGESLERYLPPLFWAVLVLAITGVILIVGEPTRAPFRVIFWAKLGLVAAGVTLTGLLARRLRGADPGAAAKALAVATLLTWAAVIFAGRWIGYANPWPGAPL